MNELREPFDPEKIERPYVKEWGHHAVYTNDYDKLLAANREQKAEIERLNRIVDIAKHDRIDMKARLDAFNSGGFADADAIAGKYLDVVNELASLRASVGEKPEDAWKRASESLRKMAAYCFNEWGMTEAASRVMNIKNHAYVAPTLPAEKEK